MQNSLLWKKLYHTPGNPRPRRNPITAEEYPTSFRGPPASTQFPNRYGYLPDINSPRPADGTLVPLGRKSSPGYRPPSEVDSDERIRQLEVRLNVAEKSNRALLEEVLRLQGEVKSTNRRNDDLIREERNSRHNLESAMKINNELITQLSARIKEAEDKLTEEKTALSSLVNHTKGVEQAVRSSQNELIAKKDVQSGRIIEMRNELDSLLSSKEQLERITLQLSDELRTLKIKQDQQAADFSSVSNDLKTRNKRLEEESRNQLDALRKTSTVQTQSEHQTTQLRGQVETRLSELRDVLIDLRAKQEGEVNDRRGLEQSLTTKIHEVQQQLAESNRKREENMHKLDLLMREREHSAQADRINLNSKVADTVEDVNKRLLSKEIKIREEMQDRYLQLERLVQQEQQQRRETERAMREDNDRKFALVKHAGEESVAEIRELMKMDRAKLNATLKKLDESISIVEKQTLENKKSFEKVMSAEISQRKQHEQSTSEKMGGLNEKLQLATSSLQQSIGGLTQAMQSNMQKQRQDVRQLMQDHKEATTRAMTDLDARVNFMKSRMNEFEEKLEARVATPAKTPSPPTPSPQPPRSKSPPSQPPKSPLNKEATQLLSENLREKVETISVWQDTTQQTIKEMSITLAKLPEEVYAVQEKQTLMKNEVDSRVTAESEKRSQDIEALKQEIEALKLRRDPNPATQQDISNVQASLRKMADSIQTVKTVLGMKIQSEQKLRADEVQKLQDEIAILRTALEPLVKKPLPRSFIKNPNQRNNQGEDTPDVNKHSVANAYRRGNTRDSGIDDDSPDEDPPAARGQKWPDYVSSDEDEDVPPRRLKSATPDHKPRGRSPRSERKKKSHKRSPERKGGKSKQRTPSREERKRDRRKDEKPRSKSRDKERDQKDRKKKPRRKNTPEKPKKHEKEEKPKTKKSDKSGEKQKNKEEDKQDEEDPWNTKKYDEQIKAKKEAERQKRMPTPDSDSG